MNQRIWFEVCSLTNEFDTKRFNILASYLFGQDLLIIETKSNLIFFRRWLSNSFSVLFCLNPISFSVTFVVILKFPLKPTKSSISELSHLISITENGILCIWSGFILVYPFFHSVRVFFWFQNQHSIDIEFQTFQYNSSKIFLRRS